MVWRCKAERPSITASEPRVGGLDTYPQASGRLIEQSLKGLTTCNIRLPGLHCSLQFNEAPLRVQICKCKERNRGLTKLGLCHIAVTAVLCRFAHRGCDTCLFKPKARDF